MHMMSDGNSRVRSSALKLLTASLIPVRRLPRSDANVFSEYILPIINGVNHFPQLLKSPPYLTYYYYFSWHRTEVCLCVARWPNM